MKRDLKDLDLGAVGEFFKNIWQDLVNKRLLPVAIVLVVALLAVPIVLGRGGSDVAPAPAVPVASSGAGDDIASSDPVELETTRPNGQDAEGDPTNPFDQPAAADKQDDAATSKPPADSGSGDGGSDTNKNPDDSKKSSEPNTAYKIDVLFGIPGQTKSKKNVTALTPFPSADDAYIVYLGAIDSGKTAVFLISTDVKATGDGVCSPSETTCRQVEMRAGDTELFDVSDTSSGVSVGSYELQLRKIHR